MQTKYLFIFAYYFLLKKIGPGSSIKTTMPTTIKTGSKTHLQMKTKYLLIFLCIFYTYYHSLSSNSHTKQMFCFLSLYTALLNIFFKLYHIFIMLSIILYSFFYDLKNNQFKIKQQKSHTKFNITLSKRHLKISAKVIICCDSILIYFDFNFIDISEISTLSSLKLLK